MRIEYGSEILGDDAAGDFVEDHGGGHARLVQQDALAGGNATLTIARGNQSNQRSFTVDRQHADAATAVNWWNTHPEDLPDSGTLRITEGPFAAEMPDAVLVSVERLQLTGRSTVLRYNFTGGRISEAA